MKKVTLKLAFLIFFAQISAVFCEFNLPPNPVNYFEQPFDVVSYDFHITFDNPADKYIDGICQITFISKSLSPEQRFYFHLWGPEIDSVFLNSERVEFYEAGDVESGTACYFINYVTTVAPESFVAKIYYQGNMISEGGNMDFGGVHYDDEILYSMGVGFNINYVSTTRAWLPCFDHPSDKAEVVARFDVPAKYTVASIGAFASKTETDNGRTVYTYKSFDDIATYLMTFAVGEFDTVRFHHSSKNLPMTVYAKANQIEAVRYAFETLPEILDAYESYFGEYPFDKLDYVLTEKGSMEHQTLVNIASSVVMSAYNSQNKYNSTIIHELAHMWFGNSVTPLDFRDAWLNESFASFCEAYIYEKIFDKARYIKHLRDQGITYFNYGIPREGAQAIYDFDRAKAGNYPITIYYKGSNVLSILRYLVGDEKFLGALNHYLTKYAYGNVNTEQFISTFEEFTQTDLTEFFDKWVYEAGWIELHVDVNSVIDKGDGSFESNVTLSQTQTNQGLPIIETPIEFSYSQFEMTPIHKLIMLDANEQAVQFTSSEHSFSSISSYRVNWGNDFVVPARIARYTSVESPEIAKPYEISDSQFTFEIKSDSYAEGIALITDVNGKIIESVNFDKQSISFDKNIFANGLYFVIINLNNHIYIEKFIK
ncbi:MAG: hypothetical protein M9949_00465 [Candidatus Kapabacteria bacterium]|nr:hypothetical protein [Candidatus Kapabacteria bacterium]